MEHQNLQCAPTVGEAVVDILFGMVNPGGKLAESFPKKLEDNPSYLYYSGEGDVVEYRVGILSDIVITTVRI